MEIGTEFLIPYIISNAAALLILWFSVRKQEVAKALLALLFCGAGIFNVYNSFANPSSYRAFADTTVFEFYRQFIAGFFTDNTTLIVSAISIAQMYVGISMLMNGIRFRVGCIGGITFGLAIAPLGIGSAFPASLVMSFSFLVLLVVREREHTKRFV